MTLRSVRVDAVTGVLLTVLGLTEAVLGLTAARTSWYAVALVPVVTLGLVVRRRHPAPVLLLVLVGMTLQAAAGSDLPGGFTEPVALVLVLYAVGSRCSLGQALGLLALSLGGTAAVITLGGDPHAGNYVYAATLVAAGWGAGRVAHLADERASLLAERRAEQERGRIARELHDVFSHNLSAIVVQAAAHRRDLPAHDPVATVLQDIEEHGRETLHELRRLLGLLRIDEGSQLPLTPQPGLDDLPRLVDTMRGQGLDVSWVSTGERRPMGSGLELAIYRVVQESLTNVRKHAREPRARMVLAWRADGVEVEVVSAGEASRTRLLPGSGFGLRAMAERVHAYGGELTARPTAEGFRVHVALPLDVVG